MVLIREEFIMGFSFLRAAYHGKVFRLLTSFPYIVIQSKFMLL
jgi:hypothetical protein